MRQCPNCLAPISWGEKTALDHRGDCTLVYCDSTCQSEYIAKQSRKRSPPINRIMFAIVAALAALIALIYAAQAAPLEGSDLRDRDFFNALTAPNGTGCCTEADCRYIENEDWRIKDGHFEVFIESAWIPVPQDKVLPANKSPKGKPVLCRRGTSIYCFAPDVLT